MKYGYMVSGGAHDETCLRMGTVRADSPMDAARIAVRKHASRRTLKWNIFGRLFGHERPLSELPPTPETTSLALTRPPMVFTGFKILDDGHADRVWVAAELDGNGLRRMLPLARIEHKARKALDREIRNMPHGRNRRTF